MWQNIKALLAAMFASKKFVAALAGMIVALVAKVGWDVDTEIVLGILGLFGTYVLGQGIADNGKEAVKEDRKLEQ
jgi:putative Mn2+ efflux pump MntP